jgi:hypothetical protein
VVGGGATHERRQDVEKRIAGVARVEEGDLHVQPSAADQR